MLRWKHAILATEKARGRRDLRARRQFNRALRGGSDSDTDPDDYKYSSVSEEEEEEEEDTRSEMEKLRAEQRRRFRERQEREARDERIERNIGRMERAKKKDKIVNALWTISNNNYNWKEGRPLWTKSKDVTDVYDNLAHDGMTIDAFAEELVNKYPDDEAKRDKVVEGLRADVKAWKENGGYPPKLSDTLNLLES